MKTAKPDPKSGPDKDEPHPKRQKFAGKDSPPDPDLFDALPDDLIVSILSRLSSSADSPSDLVSALVTCKRLNALGSNASVLSRASRKCLVMRAKNWSESGHRFLKRCSDSGNLEALFTLGMIRFYCLERRLSGLSLMASAALGSHPQALYSLAVIQFNGSGGDRIAKNLGAGFVLCARAATLGHVDATRELGYCLIDGHGVSKNAARGRNLLVRANVNEIVGLGFGSDPDPHPVNRFLREWFGFGFGSGEGEMRMCSYEECGRRESRGHEFRRCAVCGKAHYCSRACQARHWSGAHKGECVDMWAEILGEGEDE